MPAHILSVDIGSSSLKAALIDFDGHVLAFERITYGRTAYGAAGAQDWEHAFTMTLRSLQGSLHGAVQAGPNGGLCSSIEGICISGNGPTLVPLCRDGASLAPLYWNHEKASLPAGAESKSFFLPHAAWFKDNAPEKYEKVALFISSHEWLAFRLGAEALTVLPSEPYKPYYWDDEQCRLYALDSKKFPPFVKAGSVMGKVSAGAAARYGLKAGTPIIAGGPDFISALIGSRTEKSGDVCDRAGSSEGINVCAGSPGDEKLLAEKGLRVLPHAVEGLWNVGVVIASSGTLFEQYRESQGNREYGELLAELIPHSPLPTPYSLLPTPNSPLDAGRMVLYAIGFSVRSALERLGTLGFPVKEMKVSGGQGKNPLWNQLKADITATTLVIPEICDCELAGNAVIAAVALGEAKDREEAAGRMIRFRDIYKPSAKAASFWEEYYSQYKNKGGDYGI